MTERIYDAVIAAPVDLPVERIVQQLHRRVSEVVDQHGLQAVKVMVDVLDGLGTSNTQPQR